MFLIIQKILVTRKSKSTSIQVDVAAQEWNSQPPTNQVVQSEA